MFTGKISQITYKLNINFYKFKIPIDDRNSTRFECQNIEIFKN